MPDFRTWSDDQLDEFIGTGVGAEREGAAAERTRRHLIQAERRSDERHQALLAEQQRLKAAIGGLHRVDVAILIVGLIAAIAGVLLLFLELSHGSVGAK